MIMACPDKAFSFDSLFSKIKVTLDCKVLSKLEMYVVSFSCKSQLQIPPNNVRYKIILLSDKNFTKP